jgi:uncharacterized protein involved in high-affinity Fe2+ transport
LLIVLLFAACSTAFAQAETTPADTSKNTKYGPVYQLEIKDQASGEAFRGMKVVKKFTRRLPNFYSQVVTDTQKNTVYDIQSAYFEPIEMLTLRLERLKAERDAQIEAVLTAGQKTKVDALNKDSLTRRAATRAANANAN